MLTYLVLGMTYAFAAAVQPGPLQAYTISQTLSHGWRRALPAAFSPLLSDGPIIVLVLLVLSRLPAWLIPAVRCAGGVLLLFLAFLAARSWRGFDAGRTAPATAEPRSLMGATLVNLMSPGPYLGWSLVMGPLLLKGWHEAPANGIALLAGFYGVMVLGMAAIILIAGAARGLGPRVNRAMVGASALALAGLGIYQLWSWAADALSRSALM
jgi:threonine/homoserine/homoserine lactone efflux protein